MTAPVMPTAGNPRLDAIKENLRILKDYYKDDPAQYQHAVQQFLESVKVTPQDEMAPEGPESFAKSAGRAVAATGATIAQGIPGMEAAQSGITSLASRLPGMGGKLSFGEARDLIRSETANIPAPLRFAEQAIGGAATGAIKPLAALSPAMQGMIYGGASGALSADDESLTARGVKTVAGAAAGGAIGKLGERIGAGIQAMRTPGFDKQASAMTANRAASARELYGAAMQEGRTREATKHVQDFLADPEIAGFVDEIAGTAGNEHLAPDSPEMLDRVFKLLSEREGQALKGQLNGTRTASNQLNQQGARVQKERLLGAIETPEVRTIPGESVPVPPMETAQSPNPDIRTAIGNFYGRSAEAARRTDPAETVAQQAARTALERNEAYGAATPSLTGAPAKGGTVQLSDDFEATVPPFMSKYREAVNDYATRTGELKAATKGYDAVRQELTGNLPAGKNVLKQGEQGLEEWLRTASPEEVDAARRGILGAAKMDMVRNPMKNLRGLVTGSGGNAAAAKMLRTTGSSGVSAPTLNALLAALLPQ